MKERGIRTYLGTVALVISLAPIPTPALDFNFTTTGFSAPALDALNRAAAMWSSRIDDPITVNITTEFKILPSASVIGTAGSVILVSNSDFSDDVIDQLKLDAAAEAGDGIVASLPAIL